MMSDAMDEAFADDEDEDEEDKVLGEFEKQNEMMGMKEEMMADAMDDAFADDEDEDEEENVLGSVLQELGVDLANKMADAGAAPMQQGQAGAEAAAQPTPAAAGGGGDDL